MADPIHADDIRWYGDAIANVETVDLLTLTDAEVFERAESMQIELGVLRPLLYQSLTRIAALTVEADRYQFRIRALVHEIRRLRGGRR